MSGFRPKSHYSFVTLRWRREIKDSRNQQLCASERKKHENGNYSVIKKSNTPLLKCCIYYSSVCYNNVPEATRKRDISPLLWYPDQNNPFIIIDETRKFLFTANKATEANHQLQTVTIWANRSFSNLKIMFYFVNSGAGSHWGFWQDFLY